MIRNLGESGPAWLNDNPGYGIGIDDHNPHILQGVR
jgi:hypothetical protein